MTTFRSRLAGLGASLVLTAIVVALPVLLIATRPTRLPSLGSPDDGTLALLAIWGFACIVWVLLTGMIVTEVVAAIRGFRRPQRRAVSWPQNLVRNLVATAALLFVATPTLTALPAPVAAAQPIPTPPPPDPTSSPAKAAPTEPATVDYVVQRGDSLWRIAERHLGDGNRYPEIVDLNTKLLKRGPDFIRQGWTIKLPAIKKVNGYDNYTVRKGDTLSEIALEELGNAHAWPKIAAASRSIVQPDGRRLTDPDQIDIGWTLHIPTRATPPGAEPEPDTVDEPDTPPTSTITPTPTPVTAAPTPLPSPSPSVPTPTNSATEASAQPEPATAEADASPDDVVNEDVEPSWMLLGLTGPGLVLAGALWWLLRRRRRNQFRHRRPGRRPATIESDLVPVERSIHRAATTGAEDLVQHLDAALKTLAIRLGFDGHSMPQLAAVQLNGDGISLHLTEPVDQLPTPWIGEGSEWRLAPAHFAELEHSEQAAPFPLLVTVGADSDGGLWLVNAEQFGTLTLSGDPDYAIDLARAVTAELAVAPWAEDARVECIGVAGEVRPLNPARIRHHDEPTHVVDLVTGAIEHAERLDATGAPDTPTARATDADLDTWPAHLLIITGDHAGLAAPLQTMVVERPGRTGTAVVLVDADTSDDSNLHLNLTTNGRLAIPELGLDLVPAGITSDEAEGFARLLVQANSLADAPIPVNTYAEQGWETLADQTGAIREDLTVPRDSPADATTNLLPEADDEYLETAATTADDLARLAPKVPIATSAAIAAADPTLDADLADWNDPSCVRPRLRLLGPVAVELADGGEPAVVGASKGSFVELLAFLATRTRGATTQQVADAMRIDPSRVRNTVNRLREWLGKHPDNEQPYVPLMSRTHATKTSGVRAYELQGVLVDADLFRRLRLRGQAKGPAGLDDLRTALSLVTGEPLTGFNDNRGNWIYDGERVDQQYVVAIADVAHIVATAEHQAGNHLAAREAALIALKADPYGETARLDYQAAGGPDLGEPPDLPESPFPSDEDWPERTRKIVNHTVREKASSS